MGEKKPKKQHFGFDGRSGGRFVVFFRLSLVLVEVLEVVELVLVNRTCLHPAETGRYNDRSVAMAGGSHLTSSNPGGEATVELQDLGISSYISLCCVILS